MPVHLLNPSYVLLNYHSVFAQHRMTLPTRAWDAGAGTNGFGGYEAWDLSDRDALDMITDFANKLCALLHSTVIFDTWVIYHETFPAGPLVPVASEPFVAVAGTEATPGWYEAVQGVFTFYDIAFNTAKISLLEYASLDNFARRSYATASADEVAVADEFMDVNNAWASRGGYRPNNLRSLSLGINDALKKQYSSI
jgi:hypothetical protein